MQRIKIYTTRWCGFCVRAKTLLESRGLPYEEIARVMETPVGTVKSRIARARAHLRVLLDARGELSASRERHVMGGDEEK